MHCIVERLLFYLCILLFGGGIHRYFGQQNFRGRNTLYSFKWSRCVPICFIIWTRYPFISSLNDSITVILKHLKMQSKVRLNWCFDQHKVRVHFMSYEISPKYDTEMFLLGIAIVLENCFWTRSSNWNKYEENGSTTWVWS